MCYFRFVFIFIFATLLAACTSTEIQTEYVVVTATPEATIAISTDKPAPTLTPTPVTKLVMARQNIPAGVQIEADMVEVISFPAIYAPQSGQWTGLCRCPGSHQHRRFSSRQCLGFRGPKKLSDGGPGGQWRSD